MKALLLAVSLILGPCAAAQVTFTSVGDIMFGSDGSTATTIGGTTFVHGASALTYQALGLTIQNGLTSTMIEKIGGITSLRFKLLGTPLLLTTVKRPQLFNR